jgi:segregation and condensation protein B
MEVTVDEVAAALTELEQEYAAAHRGFTLRSVGGGWRVYSRPDYAPVVEKFLLDGQQARLTHAALETLAVIAYRQPVSRGRVSAVRGVNVDGVIRTLLTRGLIEELDEAGEGGSILYGTTSYFLERMGLGSLDDLPAIAPFLPEVDALDELAERGRG